MQGGLPSPELLRETFMNFEISEDQAELSASVRSVLQSECPPAIAREIVESGHTTEQPWKSAKELGWTAIAVPEQDGGLGLGFEELGLVVEEHGRALAPGPFLATVTQFLPAVLEVGSAEQRGRFARPAEYPSSGLWARDPPG